MARPLSEEKRMSLLAAATRVIAEQGLSASTAGMAKLAGVAEGTLFTYFANKDALLGDVYVYLKSDLAAAMMAGYPAQAAVRIRAQHVWNGYLDWSVRHPERHAAMAQLGVSKRLDAATRLRALEGYDTVGALLGECAGPDLAHGAAFAGATMGALADMTIGFMLTDPAGAQAYAADGFNAFWRAVGAG